MEILFLIVVAVVVIAIIAVRKSKTEGASESKPVAPAAKAAKPPKQDTKVSAPPSPEPSETEKSAARPKAEPVIKGESQTAPSPLAADVPPELEQSIAALEHEKDPVARHRLYQTITDASYKNRDDAATRALCKVYSQRHVDEFGAISKPLKKANGGKLPHVATFQNYANLLAEDGEFDGAIAVCEAAIRFGLDDKTKSGFAGRKARIEKQKAKA